MPVAGDLAVINAGTVQLGALPAGVALSLSSTQFSSPTLQLAGTAIGPSSPVSVRVDRSNATFTMTGTVVNQSLLSVSGTGLGGSLPGSLFISLANTPGGATEFRNDGVMQVNGSTLQLVSQSSSAATVVTNNGIIDITNPYGGVQQAFFGANLAGSGTFVLGNGVSYTAGGRVASSLTYSFVRGEASASVLNMPTGLLNEAVVNGFAAQDTITVQSFAWDSYAYSSTGVDVGVLTLLRGGSAVDTITFRGEYTRDSFQVTQGPPDENEATTTTIRTTVPEVGGAALVSGGAGNDTFQIGDYNKLYSGGAGYDTPCRQRQPPRRILQARGQRRRHHDAQRPNRHAARHRGGALH